MDDPNAVQDPTAEEEPATQSGWGIRFSPHVIVFLLTLLAAIPPLRGAFISGVHWWWDKDFRKVEFVMDEARPNDGSPYIAGHLEGTTDQHNLVGLMQGTTMVIKMLPQEAFVPGKRIPIWHSPNAPNGLIFGDEFNDVPVAALPQRPGLRSLLDYAAWLFVTFVVGFGLMGWVAHRWSGTYGNLPMRRRRAGTGSR